MKHILLLLALIPTTVELGKDVICRRDTPKIDAAQAKCLATTIYGEARGESEQGQVAVAYTVMNRAVNRTLCQVALAHKQYSIFNNNPELRAAATSLHINPKQKNIIDQQSWDRAVKVANMVIQRAVKDPTNGATHYLAPIVMKAKHYRYPRWSKEYKLVAVIDGHKFFKA
jgi:N-acetylmuramoyl-L-alanine amidase